MRTLLPVGRTVDQIKAVITDIMSGMETFESDVQGPSEEFVLGHVQLLWSMIRHRDPMTPHYPDVFKDIFRDAGKTTFSSPYFVVQLFLFFGISTPIHV
jgi:hypothetical protein